MSPTTTALICGVLIPVAGWMAWRAIRPAPLTLRAVQARVAPRMVAADSPISTATRIGGFLSAGAFGRLVDQRLASSLRLTGHTVPTVIGQIVVTAAVAGFTVFVVLAGLVATGTTSASPILWLLVPIVAALFGWRVVLDIRARAARRRTELRRVVNDFVQLLAVALTTNRSIEDALTFAADAGEGDGFDLLRQTVATAQPMGITVWDALNAMADTYDLPELRGLTTSLQRQAGVGVSVAATIRTEAKSLRAKQLTELTDRADQANANLSLPTMGMVIGMVLFLAYPIMRQISEAFT
ncbi:type II secretion system F family protein [Ilumatobacter sp.]|uniref:type II secretion system F family protein n=1 Tax=Ilumatobacter sp. TaxID=1967498 RepID=UPI003B52B377